MLHKLLLLIFLVALICILLFLESWKISTQADQDLLQGDADQAISLYKQAQKVFPLRFDLVNKILGAQLVQQSNLDYQQISGVDAEIENAEIQNVPSLSQIPSNKVLKPGEILVPILMYHHIQNNPRPYDPVWVSLFISPDQLKAQFNYLALHNFHPITLDQLYNSLKGAAVLPTNPVVLTFDDGYKDFYINAFPLLKLYQFKATEFVITGVTTYPAYLTWDQITELDQSGLVEIGAHTQSHPNLPSLSRASIIKEINGSKSDIEGHLKKPVHWFAYPYGSYNDFIVKSVQDAGYLGAASVIYSPTQSLDKIYTFPRIMVDGKFNLDEFAKRLYQ